MAHDALQGEGVVAREEAHGVALRRHAHGAQHLLIDLARRGHAVEEHVGGAPEAQAAVPQEALRDQQQPLLAIEELLSGVAQHLQGHNKRTYVMAYDIIIYRMSII